MFCSKCGTKNENEACFCSGCGGQLTTVGTNVQPPEQIQSFKLEQTPRYAGFWYRALAWVIDTSIATIGSVLIILPLAFALGASMAGKSTATEISYAGGDLGRGVGFLITWLYFTISESSPWQATPGKKWLGIKVTDEAGNRIGFGRANGRYWSKILSALILCIGYIMVAFTEKKQGLHDKIAGTLVIKKNADQKEKGQEKATIPDGTKEGSSWGLCFAITMSFFGIFIVFAIAIGIRDTFKPSDSQVSKSSVRTSTNATAQKYISEDELFGKNKADTQQNPFDQFDQLQLKPKDTLKDPVSESTGILIDPEKRKQLNAIFGVDTSSNPPVIQTEQSVVVNPDQPPGTTPELDMIFGIDRSKENALGEIGSGSNRQDNPADWQEHAFTLQNLQDWRARLDWCQEWTKSQPDSAASWFFLGNVYLNIRHYKEAINSYSQSLKINPIDHNAWYNLGTAYSGLTRYKEAIKAYRQATRIKSDFADTWYNLGLACHLSGDQPAALDAVKELRRLDPRQADKLYNLIVPR